MSNGAANNLSNPFSTSGGGVTFEQLVGASYLVSLLAGDIPRGLDWGICKEVKFQYRWSGCLLDDIVITSTDGNKERKLALQVKHNLTFSDSASNTTFAHVIKDCWKTFTGSFGWQFNQDIDRLGIGLGVYQNKIAEHFQPLLEWSRTSKDAAELMQKVSQPRFSSREKREYLQLVRKLLTKAKGSDITDNEMWRFLRCFVVIHFDLENAGSRDSVHCWNRLLDQLKDRDESQAKSLFNTLTSIVQEYARSAGSIDACSLRTKELGSIALKDQMNFISDLNHLRNHSDTILRSISDTIGGRVHLPRTEIVNQLEANVKENEVVVISGEPMVGKSVLLKLLVNRLRSEGEIIVFSVERLFGATLEEFLHSINIQNDLRTILSAVGNSPLRCVLVDGLEHAIDKEDRKRVLNDLIIAIRKYNASILAKGGHKDYCWRIVYTCRLLEAPNLLLHLETRTNLFNKSLKVVKVEALSNEEVAEVVAQLPKLKDLASKGYLKEILSRPLILDILTLPDISSIHESVPSTLSESWLLHWFWKEVVRLAEKLRPGRGNPTKREQLLIRIAKQSLRGDKLIAISDDMASEAVSGLVSDRILVREDDHLQFSHDVYEDWTLTMLLKDHKDEIPRFLIQIGEPLRLVRAFHLYAARLLEVEQSSSAWLNLLTALEKETILSPRWYQIALTAPLFSPLLKEIWPRIQSHLSDNGGALLSNFLKALRTICVKPSPMATRVFGDLPQAEFEKYLAYWTIPVREQWLPVIQFVLQNENVIKDKVSFEFSHIAEKWMINTEKNDLFRKEIANLSLKILNDGLLQSYKDKPKNQFIKSVLWAADCLPDKVKDFVTQKTLRDRENENYGFEELILKEGWIPICKHLPNTAADILEAILCEKLAPDRFGSYHHLFVDLAIRYTMWSPPTYFKGPFLGLLRFHPDKGLQLIHRITNHATQCWKMREELDWGRKPILQIVKLKKGNTEVYGDEHVYSWFRYPSVAPNAINCALMALEYWMNERIRGGVDPQELFEKVLQDTKSAAVVGVCSSVALANKKLCLEAIIPILENPAFWILDIHRLTNDMMAESSVTVFSKYFSFGYNEADYKILIKLSGQPHRKFDIRSFVFPIMLSGSEETRERLQNAIRTFPDNPPFMFEDEKEDNHLVQERIETCKIWATQVEPKNYETFETGVEGQIGIRFKLPKELEEQQIEKSRSLEKLNKLYSFHGWSTNLLDKSDVGQAFTNQSAMEYAQDLVRQDNPSYQPKDFLENSEQRARAIATFVAALVIRQWRWAEKNDYVSWCRKQLLIAAKRPEPPANVRDKVSRFPMGYRRSAARALPILLSKNPKDKQIRRAIFELSTHRNYEVRAYLFNALKALWPVESKIIWKCIYSIIKASRKEAIYRKFWYLEKQLGVGVAWRKYADMNMLIKQIKKSVHLLSVRFYPNPIRNCSSDDIDSHHLQSILYCLPSDIQITQISSSSKLVNFLEELLLFTINNYIHSQQEDKHYNKWAYNDWNHLFFPIIANALLRLPQSIAHLKLCDPIINNWEKAPAMMEEFLRQLIFFGSQPELEDRLIELWPHLGGQVLISDHCKSLRFRVNKEMKNILGLLIFSDPTRIIKWNIQEWAPLKKMTHFISRWCSTVGHHPDCYSSLVRLLETIGFSLIPERGVGWLYSCIIKVDNHKEFFERSGISSLLAELLYDSWSKQELSIKQNLETFKHFAFLVDKVAEQGESIAIRLQSKLQATI